MDQFTNYTPGIKKYLGWYTTPMLLGITVAIFSFAFWYAASGWQMIENAPDRKRTLSFSGEGKVAARPDIAVFSTSVIVNSKKVKDAQLENSKRSNAVIGFLKEQRVEEKDIKTISYSIMPQYEYFDVPPCEKYPCLPRRPPEVVSYEVRHALEIKVRDLGQADDLLDGVVASGANEVGSIDFRIDDPEKLKAEARKKAIENAREKAKILTQDLRVRLGKIVAFYESGGDLHSFARVLAEKGGLGGDHGSLPVSSPQIEPGEQEVKVVVTITYEFR